MPSDPGSAVWAVVGVLVVFVLVLVRVVKGLGRAGAGRPERMRRLAESLGMRYFGSIEPAALDRLPRPSLLEQDAARGVRNLMGDKGPSPERMLFDCELRPPRARPETGLPSELHLVALARVRTAGLAPFRVYREDLLGGPVGVRGLRRLGFEDDPEFTYGYLVAGQDWERIGALLTAPVRAAIRSGPVRGPRPVVELLEGWLAVHVESRPGDQMVERRGEELVRYACRIRDALALRTTPSA